MSKLDWVAAWLLFALGCVHNFVVAPMSFHQLDSRALWFITGGMSLWFAAGLNLLWLSGRDRPAARWTAAGANLAMLAFTLAYAAVLHQFGSPAGWLLIGIVAWLAGRSLFVSPAPLSAAM
jgi:hypothetical protein